MQRSTALRTVCIAHGTVQWVYVEEGVRERLCREVVNWVAAEGRHRQARHGRCVDMGGNTSQPFLLQSKHLLLPPTL